MEEVKAKIKAYLDERAAKDELFAKSYAKEKKSIDECIRFIMGEAAKEAVACPGGKGAFMSDEWVYGQAVHYYDEDDIKVAPVRGDVKVSTNMTEPAEDKPAETTKAPDVKVRITKQDRERAKKEAMERIIEEERKKMLAPRKKQRQEAELPTQMSLFE